VEQVTLKNTSSVYGPVKSWRVGNSLGIDLLMLTSTCSFNCIYCQLGNIQHKTKQRRLFVPIEKIEADLKAVDFDQVDIITFSGSGEPTLALNIRHAIRRVKEISGKPVMVLTNGTLLDSIVVRDDLRMADIVSIKLDAAQEQVFQIMNRPVDGITLEGIIQGAIEFRKEFKGKLCLQCMFMPGNLAEAEAMAEIVNRIQPDEIQLNTPKRPYPLEWHLDSRGNHSELQYPSRPLRVISQDEAQRIEQVFRDKTKIPIISVY